ncbi:MAG: FAD-dependent oxidoreductase [Chloroflexi bacterium]|nr:FAD-dependent oxidoreductase [Chloroflexota bacterium]
MKISIVGGGIAGCATAYYLTQADHDVTLFERDSLASHASGFALGGLLPSIGGSPDDPYDVLTHYSIGLHKELAERLTGRPGDNAGGSLDFLRKPSLILARDPAEEESMRRAYGRYADDYALDIRWLSFGEFSHIDARISLAVAGALYVSEAYEVDPYKLTLALWQAAEQQGARLVNRDVRAIAASGDRVSGVVTKDGVNEADAVVVAAGPWSSELLTGVGVTAPVTPLKGQIIRLDAPGPPPKVSLWWDHDYATAKTDGLLWVGTTEEEVGFDDGTTDAARDRIIASAIEVLPYLEDAELVQQTACLRPVTPDSAPIIDAEPGPDGLVIVTGAGRQGIMLGPAMGIAAAALATGAEPPVDVSAFALARFS